MRRKIKLETPFKISTILCARSFFQKNAVLATNNLLLTAKRLYFFHKKADLSAKLKVAWRR